MAKEVGGPERHERIGILGGTFDPPHIGHLVVASHVRAELDLDRVLLVVADRPWQKVGKRVVSPSSVRLAMVAASVAGVPGLEASDLEIQRGGDSFTVDTVDELLAVDPSRELFVIVGADVDLGSWRRIDEVRDRATIVRVDRAGTSTAGGSAPGELAVVVPRLDVSSSDLRTRFAEDRPVEQLVDPVVQALVRDEGLYRGGS